MLAQLQNDDVFPLIVISIGCGVVVIWMVLTMITTLATRSQTEKSRREIAAYIAEGSMTPEEGERLLKAGKEKDS